MPKSKMPKSTATHPYKLTPEQKATAKKLRDLRDGCLAKDEKRLGQMFVGPMGIGKTGILGAVNRKQAPKGKSLLNLFVNSNPKQAEAQADEVRAEIKALNKRKIESTTFYKELKKSPSVTATLTPTVLRNLVDPKDHSTSDALVQALKDAGCKWVHLAYDEVHKAYGSRCLLPKLVDDWRERLHHLGIRLIVTGITATPKYTGGGAPKAAKERERLGQRCCTLIGVPVPTGSTACAILEGCTAEIGDEEVAAIFAVTRGLQTDPPKEFEQHSVAIQGTRPSKELKTVLGDSKTLLLGLALDGVEGHIDRFVGYQTCLSLANAQAVLGRDGLVESVLGPKEGLKVHLVERKDAVMAEGNDDSSDSEDEEACGNDALRWSKQPVTCRANALLVADTPAATKLIVDTLNERSEDEGTRKVKFFNLAATDRGEFYTNMEAFKAETTSMKDGHPIGVIDKSQLESCNDFGKGCFNLLAVGDLPSQLLVQGPGRLGRSVPMNVGDLVPIDGYSAHHIASKGQTTLSAVFRRKPSRKEALTKANQELLGKYEEQRKPEYEREMREDLGLEDEADWPEDMCVERAATKALQLAKIDKDKLLLAPHDLAKTYLEALTDDAKKTELLADAFGQDLDGEDEDCVLAKYKNAPRAVSAALRMRSGEAPGGIQLDEADDAMDDGKESDSVVSTDDEEKADE